MKRYILTLFAIFSAVAVAAWPVEKTPAFKSGEKLSYVVSYKMAGVDYPLAEARITTNLTTLDGASVYHVHGNGKILKLYNWIFKLNDTYEVWLDEKTLAPLKFANDLNEGKYKKKNQYYYDWNTMVANTISRNAKWDADRQAKVDLVPGSMDPLSIFFNLRSYDIGQLYEGQDSILNIVFANKIEKIRFKFIGRETKTIKRVGTFKALKFSCQLTTDDDDDSLPSGAEFHVWVTDDRNKVPLYLESPIRVGSIQAFITKMENLKYPLDSKIK